MDDFIPDSQFHPDADAPTQTLAANAPAPTAGGDFIPDRAFVPDEEKYGSLGQEALTAVEGGAKGLLGPIATAGEAGLSALGVPGLTPSDQAGRQAASPWIHGGAETATLAGPAILSGGMSLAARAGMELPEGAALVAKAFEGPLARVLDKSGNLAEKIAPSIGIGGPGAGVLAKIGSSAVRGAVENGLYQAGDEASRLINGDPSQSVETSLAHVGLGSLIGGGLGGATGTVSSLWRATLGSKTGALLNAAAEHMGGIDGVEANPVTELVSKTGMDVPGEIQAGLTNDPAVREMFDTLNQSDTTNSGREFQQTKKDFEQKAAETLSDSLGRPADQIPDDFDKYTHGKNIGNTLADEVDARVAPLKEGYNQAAEKFAGKDLAPSLAQKEEDSTAAVNDANQDLTRATKQAVKAQAAGDPGAAIEAAGKVQDAQAALTAAQRAAETPGTVDILQEKLANLAQKERWTLAPDDEIMKTVNGIQKDLQNPDFKTLSDLTAYIKRIDEKMPFDPFNGSRNRAAGMIKSIFRDTEGELIGNHIGSEEGADALAKYRETQTAYGAESRIKEELQDRLGKLGSTSSYGKTIREMSQSDAESVFRKLSGKDDADVLRLLNEHFPKTAAALREAHVDQLLTKAKVGDTLSPGRIMTGLDKLSPQLRNFVIPSEAGSRVDAIGQMLEKLKDTKYNYSATGRTLDKLFQYIPGSAVGMVSMLMGHNPAVGLLLGGLTKYVSKDAPDAVRLGLLKWLGSNKPIEAGAFKSMVDFIHSTIKGDSLMDKATKGFFSGASKVIPEHLMPSETDTKDLDHKLKKVQANPKSLESVATNTGYYMPDHAIAMTGTATNASQYVNSQRPSSMKMSPLDPETEPSQEAQAKFNRVLQIAQQPLMLAHLAKEGTLTSEDMNHARAMYPAFTQSLAQKMTNAMIEHTASGNPVPYRQRQALSTLMGQPMDSSMSPQAVQQNQAVFMKSNAQEAAKNAPMSKTSQIGVRDMKVANRISLSPDEDES